MSYISKKAIIASTAIIHENVTIEDNKWIKSPFIDEYCKINILGGEEFEKELTARNNTEE